MPFFSHKEMDELCKIYKTRRKSLSICQSVSNKIKFKSNGHPGSFMLLLRFADEYRPEKDQWFSTVEECIDKFLNGTHKNIADFLNELLIDQRARIRSMTTNMMDTWEYDSKDELTKYLLTIGVLGLEDEKYVRFTSKVILRVCIKNLWPSSKEKLTVEANDPITILKYGILHFYPSTLKGEWVQNNIGTQEKSFQAALYANFMWLLPADMKCYFEANAEDRDGIDLMLTKDSQIFALMKLKINLCSLLQFETAIEQAEKYSAHFGETVYLVSFHIDSANLTMPAADVIPEGVVVVNIKYNAMCTEFTISTPGRADDDEFNVKEPTF